MALFDMTGSQVGGQTFGGRLAGIVSRVLTWNDVRKTRRALSALSDHELDDIGLVRGDIDEITRY